jgi:hypothetical protein
MKLPMLRSFSRHLSSLHLSLFLALPCLLPAAVYEVGTGKALSGIGEVPWESLRPGDTVRIHWRAKPYHEKWVLCCRGTQEQPITVTGVPGPKGELPVIDGQNATKRPALSYWGEERGVLKIGGANKPADKMPAHLVIENLEIRSARRPFTFAGRKGPTAYSKDAASLIVEKADHLLLRNLTLHDSGNGLMISAQSSHVRVEGCHIYDNGNPGSITEHNAYTECNGIVFEGNHFGPLRKGCLGINLKDRSAGLVVAYNWIEGGSRQLDLVDATGNKAINASTAYRRTLVYGNVLIENEDGGNNQIVHYGGDSTKTAGYRKGVLHFYHNTVISHRAKTTVLFRPSTPDEKVECHGNILHVTAPGMKLSLMGGAGTLTMGKNWLTSGWVRAVEDLKLELTTLEPPLEGKDPGFASMEKMDFSLLPDSPCVGAASAILGDLPKPAKRYVKHQKLEELPATAPLNLGGL